ncbi:MAG: transposase [Gammaproteobacteria bacterium]|nr:transposase [Gammaproteobacteria bacterium]
MQHWTDEHPMKFTSGLWAACRRPPDAVEDSTYRGVQKTGSISTIGALYEQEAWIRKRKLEGPDKHEARQAYCKPVVEAFWQWCDEQCQRLDLTPSNPLSKALKYAMSRREALEVFLREPVVQVDTNHLERALRPIPMGRKNHLFCWTEVGAEYLAVLHSLLVTCRLQGVDPYTYLVDVLQRVGQHPAKDVIDLTPRRWKELFAANPLRSDVSRVPAVPAQ